MPSAAGWPAPKRVSDSASSTTNASPARAARQTPSEKKSVMRCAFPLAMLGKPSSRQSWLTMQVPASSSMSPNWHLVRPRKAPILGAIVCRISSAVLNRAKSSEISARKASLASLRFRAVTSL